MSYVTFHDISCKRGTGAMQRGYYRKTRNNVTYPQHRLAYMDKYGAVSSDLVIHHECHNKWCVAPEHLTPMTRSEHQAVHAGISARQYYDSLDRCPKGHPLDGFSGRQRYCKTCKQTIAKAYQARPEIKAKYRERYLKQKELTK